MKISRRSAFHLSGLGLMAFSSMALSQTLAAPFPWREVTKVWLNIFMPPLENNVGADCPEVWAEIEKLMQLHEFQQGFIAGLKATVQYPKPSHDGELEAMMLRGDEVSDFLNAFFEVVTESFFGSESGHGAAGISAPQPNGYVL